MSGIIDTDYYIPSNHVHINNIVDELSIDDEQKKRKKQYFQKIGIQNISIWKDEDEIQIISNIVYKLICQYSIDPNDIAYIAFCTVNSYATKSNVSIPYVVKEICNLKNASVYMVAQSCGSSIYSLGLMGSYFETNKEKKGIIIACNIMRRIELFDRIMNFTVIGDGCSVALVGSENCQYEINSFSAESYGIPSYNRYRNIKQNITDMQVASVAAFSMRRIIEKAGIADYKKIIAQNTNLVQLSVIAKLLRKPTEIMYKDNIGQGGHIGDTDTIRNLCDFTRKGDIQNGDHVLLYSSGLYDSGDIIFTSMVLKKC